MESVDIPKDVEKDQDSGKHETPSHAIDVMIGAVSPKDRREKQMYLATENYKRNVNFDPDLTSIKITNDIMLIWSGGGDESLSKFYRDMEDDSDFSSHPRLKGDFHNITLDDVLYYKENQKLPLE